MPVPGRAYKAEDVTYWFVDHGDHELETVIVRCNDIIVVTRVVRLSDKKLNIEAVMKDGRVATRDIRNNDWCHWFRKVS